MIAKMVVAEPVAPPPNKVHLILSVDEANKLADVMNHVPVAKAVRSKLGERNEFGTGFPAEVRAALVAALHG